MTDKEGAPLLSTKLSAFDEENGLPEEANLPKNGKSAF
jgi:hypothetical protein